jgi:hypothetical protein
MKPAAPIRAVNFTSGMECQECARSEASDMCPVRTHAQRTHPPQNIFLFHRFFCS